MVGRVIDSDLRTTARHSTQSAGECVASQFSEITLEVERRRTTDPIATTPGMKIHNSPQNYPCQTGVKRRFINLSINTSPRRLAGALSFSFIHSLNHVCNTGPTSRVCGIVGMC